MSSMICLKLTCGTIVLLQISNISALVKERDLSLKADISAPINERVHQIEIHFSSEAHWM
jgi:hemerythrin